MIASIFFIKKPFIYRDNVYIFFHCRMDKDHFFRPYPQPELAELFRPVPGLTDPVCCLKKIILYSLRFVYFQSSLQAGVFSCSELRPVPAGNI
jgi:hypothetical protein